MCFRWNYLHGKAEKKEEEIMIDTQGKPIDNSIQAQTTTKATVADSFQTSHNNEDQLQNNDNLLQFEFYLPSKDVVIYLFTPADKGGSKEEHKFWINGVLNKGTGKVISAAIGRISPQLE
jgi:hypothetical protein